MTSPIIYLAGPINGCNDDEAHGWREGFKVRLAGYTFRDPMDRDYRGREDECVREIVEGDKEDISVSNVVVAYCWQPSWGTGMELHFANDRSMSALLPRWIVVVVPEGQRVSPWLRYHSDVVVPTLEAAAQWIETYCPTKLKRAK